MPANGFLGRVGHLLGRVAVSFGLRPPSGVTLPTVEGGGTIALAEGASGTMADIDGHVTTVALGATASTVAVVGSATTTIAKDD